MFVSKLSEDGNVVMKNIFGRVEVIELVAGIILTAISIVAIVRISSLETKTSLHLRLYTNEGCNSLYTISLQAKPEIDQIDGYIHLPSEDGNGCEKLLLLSSVPIKSASQGGSTDTPAVIEVAKIVEPKVFSVWYSFKDARPGKFIINDVDLSSHVRNRLLINVGVFSLRDLTGWSPEVKKFVASAPPPDSMRLKVGFLGDYELSAEPRPDRCLVIDDGDANRASEECSFDREGPGDLLKLQADPGDLNAIQNFWVALVGLFASSGFGLFFDAIRRAIARSFRAGES